MIFFPDHLGKNFLFKIPHSEEKWISVHDGIKLNGLLFKANRSKGLILYLHGNGGSLRSWGEVANAYAALHYDIFMLDYRGYGKSEGKILSEKQIVSDVQDVYNYFKSLYNESNIIVLGYSLGTGPAAEIAARNKPKLLILQAPYYSMVDMMKIRVPFVPTFILKYRFETNIYIQKCKIPIVIFHGNEDEIIPYSSSLKLKPLLKEGDTLITLKGQGHNRMSDHPDYLTALKSILEKY